MAEVGQVIEVKENFAIIKLERHDGCDKCRACIAGIESKEMRLEAYNECNAKVGDYVNISLKKSSFLIAVLIMYVIPLISLLVGLSIGYIIGHNEGVSLVVGFLFLAATYFIIRLSDKRFSNERYRPVADMIVNK